jgi:Fe-S cluster biosynthesis and repair protein YggX
MLSWIIQISLISIIFIFLVHHLILFFKSTLTVPKIKDLVNSPNQKYQHIYDTISNNSSSSSSSSTTGYTNIELLPLNNDNDSMKDELKSFLKKQLNKNVEGENDRNVSNFNTNF